MAAGGTLRVEKLGAFRGGRRVLEGVGFEATSGEVVGLLGPNGSGKSTLLACLAGLLPVEEGSVRWDGTALSALRPRPVFLLPDALNPWPRETVAELLDLIAPRGDGTRAQLEDALDLGPFRSRPLGTLSKGQRRRALLAYALLQPRPALLLDEPFDGLDLRQQRATATLLREHAARGRLVVLALHQLREAERSCGRLVLLHEGRMVGAGTLDELRARAGLPGADLEEVVLALS